MIYFFFFDGTEIPSVSLDLIDIMKILFLNSIKLRFVINGGWRSSLVLSIIWVLSGSYPKVRGRTSLSREPRNSLDAVHSLDRIYLLPFLNSIRIYPNLISTRAISDKICLSIFSYLLNLVFSTSQAVK